MSSFPPDLCRSALLALPAPVLVLDADCSIVSLNDAAARLAGAGSAADPEAMARLSTLTPWLREDVARLWGQEGDDASLERELELGGRRRCFEIRLSRLNHGAHGTVVLLQEVTAHRRVEERLRQSEERSRTLLASLPQRIFFKDREGRFVSVNQPFAEDFHCSPEALLGKADADLFPAKLAQKYRADDVRVMESGETETIVESNVIQGKARFVEVVKAPVISEGRVIGVLGVFTDITERKRAEEARNRLSAILEATSDLVAITTIEGPVIYMNPAGRRLLGVGRDEQIQMSDFTPPWALDAILNTGIPTALKDGTWSGETAFRTRDGREIPVLQVITAHKGPDGAPEISTIARDITERKQFEQELAHERDVLHTLMANIPDQIYFKDTECRFTRVNPAAARAVGCGEPAECIGKTDFDYYPEALARAFYQDEQEILRTGKPVINKTETQRADSHAEQWISTTKVPIRGLDGRITGIVGVSRDVTERVRAEKEMQRTAAELARSNEELQQFAYVASHDLQEPLRMIASYTQLLARRYKGKLDEDADEFIGFAVDGATRMQGLINDLLAYSRVGTQGKEFEVTELSVPYSRALANLRTAIEESGAEVTADPLPALAIDPSQLVQLFQNLIGNAIKFRGEAPPRIHVGAKEREKDWLFSVQDNGIGFDKSYADRIFVIFQRLHGKTEYPGSGIGLSICKKIVNRHGGQIWVDSEPGRGSTFYFTIPNQGSNRL